MARLSFRCDEELVARVDAERGDVPRERWLRNAVLAAASVDDRARAAWERGRAVERALEGRPGASVSPGVQLPAQAPAVQPERRGVIPSVYRGSEVEAGLRASRGAHAATCRCAVCVPPKGGS